MTINHLLNAQFQLYNPVTGDTFTLNSFTNYEGIGLKQYPEFVNTFRNKTRDKDGQHGVHDFKSYYGAKAITFNCRLVANTASQAETLLVNLRKTLALPSQPTSTNKGNIRIRWDDVNGVGWEIYARVQTDQVDIRPLDMPLIADFQIQFKAFDPTIYSQTEYSDNGHQGWIQGAFILDTTDSISVPLGIPIQYNYSETVNNSGNFQTPARFRLYGYAKYPTIYNATTGVKFALENYSYELADGDYIDIDAKEGTVVDRDGNDLSMYISDDSSFIYLDRGNNEIIYYDGYLQNNPIISWESDRILALDTQKFYIYWKNAKI